MNRSLTVRPALTALALATAAIAAAVISASAQARPAERWLPIAPRDAAHGAMALNLNSLRPAAQKGLDEATALEVTDARTASLVAWEVRCGRGTLHPLERRPVDPKSGQIGPATAVGAEFAKPLGQGEEWVLEIVCRPNSAGGHVFADRRAVIWSLSH